MEPVGLETAHLLAAATVVGKVTTMGGLANFVKRSATSVARQVTLRLSVDQLATTRVSTG